jgi:uncharacterized protein
VRNDASTFVFAFSVAPLACASSLPALAPRPAPPPTCAIDGCSGDAPPRLARAPALCPAAGEAACQGASASECTARALSSWAAANGDRAVACVARKLDEACTLGDPRGCGFAGRLWIDGRGVARDTGRGLSLLVRACDGAERIACIVAERWLAEAVHAKEVPNAPALRKRLEEEEACLNGEPDACYRAGLSFYFGSEAYPRDRARAAEAYERGCGLGGAAACNNLGDALAYGDGVERDLVRAAETFDKACHLGEAIGCANSGYMFERGEGAPRDVARARRLYRDACAGGEVYGCLHADMLAAEDAGAPRDSARALAEWQRACDAKNAQACAFVGVVYEDGPDGLARDSAKSLQAMTRACGLGDKRACQWVDAHPAQ